jgi:ribosomal protein S4E
MAETKAKSKSTKKQAKKPEFFTDPRPQVNNELRVGLMAEVTDGEHEGAYGSIESVVENDKDGIPKVVTLRKRDNDSDTITVDYADLKPAPMGGRR